MIPEAPQPSPSEQANEHLRQYSPNLDEAIAKERRMQEMNEWANLTGKIAESKSSRQLELESGLTKQLSEGTIAPGEAERFHKQEGRIISEQPARVSKDDRNATFAGHTASGDVFVQSGEQRDNREIEKVVRSPLNLSNPEK